MGDTARVPYGTKSRDTVTRFSMECLGFLDNFNLKMAVVACNTASSFSLDTLKRSFDFPVIGVIEPGVKEACGRTRNNKIGVIGTRATVKSASYVKAIKKISSRVKVYQKACPLFVPLVEENWLDDDVTRAVAAKYLEEIKQKDIDTLILGCTHYPLLTKVIKKIFRSGINIIDSSLSVSNEVRTFLETRKIANNRGNKGKLRVFVTDDSTSFRQISRIFLDTKIIVDKIELT